MKLWARLAMVLVPLGVVVALPLAMRRDEEVAPGPDVLRLEIITPHNETIQREFGEAFATWYRENHGREVYVNWRVPGGTSEIKRVLDAGFAAAEAAGRVGMGIDLFFGGGSYDFSIQASEGRFQRLSIFEEQPELFAGEEPVIPQKLGGETYYGENRDWLGVCLSSFGIVYNVDGIARLGVEPPRRWEDLTQPAYFGEIALADPLKSGSVAKIFEMIIQEAMAEEVAAQGENEESLATGWAKGLNRVRRIAANSRYFADGSAKIPHDVAQGNAVAGMCIDFYGRTFEEDKKGADGRSRLKFVVPEGGTSISVDPVAILKGAPNQKIAEEFVRFLFTEKGQGLWNLEMGSENGPKFRNLRRLPVRRDFYRPENLARMTDAAVLPYEVAEKFTYRGDWTGSRFSPLRLIMGAMAIDSHEELKEAWEEMIAAGDLTEEAFFSLGEGGWPSVSYQAAGGRIRSTMKGKDALATARMKRELGEFFRSHYRQIAEQSGK
ncbi:MAG: ABC transporter substrate-binding protein [Verrucomicrobiota bacterium JB023]|nr:ABC transporter substrate-binding protein [Verrucomicrobiota bacterium JB023]